MVHYHIIYQLRHILRLHKYNVIIVMPVASLSAAAFGYGRPQRPAATPGNVPAYYTSNSGFLLNYGAFSSSATLINSSNIATGTPVLATFSNIQVSPRAWTLAHDKDADNNVYYFLPQTGNILSKYTFPKGGGTAVKADLYTDSGGPGNTLGFCYAPICMWTGTGYGAIIGGNFSAGTIRVLEFNSTKTSVQAVYTVTWTAGTTPEVYGVEVVPRAVSGFNNNYGLAYSRNNKTMTSWTVNMDTRTWANKATDSSYSGGVTGPTNGDAMIYYPIGKRIFTGDPDTSTNRVGMSDTSTARLYVWTITESGTNIVWTYLKQVTLSAAGMNPYHLSTAAYNAIS